MVNPSVATAMDSSFIEISNRYDPDNILMQCTGLKDSEGNLIWDGDILEWTLSKHPLDIKYPHIVIVAWDTGQFDFRLTRQPATADEAKGPLWIFSENCLKVIGNIYENPELLK